MKTDKGNSTLVIGCSNGVGRQITEDLLSNDFEVLGIDKYIVDIDNVNFKFVQCDISDLKSFTGVLQRINLGSVKSIFFTAGMHSTFDASSDIALQATKNLIAVNFLPHVALMQKILAEEVEVNTYILASLSSTIGLPFQQAYGASKSALQNYYEAISYELAENNCSATLFRLGAIDTGFNSKGNIVPNSKKQDLVKLYSKSVNKINGNNQISAKSLAKAMIKLSAINKCSGTKIIDYGLNSFILSIIKRILGYKFTYKLIKIYLGS